MKVNEFRFEDPILQYKDRQNQMAFGLALALGTMAFAGLNSAPVAPAPASPTPLPVPPAPGFPVAG